MSRAAANRAGHEESAIWVGLYCQVAPFRRTRVNMRARARPGERDGTKAAERGGLDDDGAEETTGARKTPASPEV